MDESSTTEALWSEQIELFRSNWGILLAYFAFYSVGYGLADILWWDNVGLSMLLGLVGWAFGYAVLVRLLSSSGSLEGGKLGGMGTYFVLGIVLGVPVYLGFLLFIIPGFYLLLRWITAYPFAILSGNAIDGLRESWDATHRQQRAIAGHLIGPVIATVAGMGLLLGFDFVDPKFEIPLLILADILFAVGWTWLAVLQVAVFVWIQKKSDYASAFD